MEIEKLDENKIKITFDSTYLQNNNISIHSFMSNSIESQALFLNLLDEAEKEVGFSTKNYKISIETLTQTKESFTLIISRLSEKKKNNKSRLHTHRKISSFNNCVSLYRFESLETFFSFSEFLYKKNHDIFMLLNEKNSLYYYENNYYLAIDKLFLDKTILFKITSLFSEFSDYVYISENAFQKLKEFGKAIIKKKAIFSCIRTNF